MSNDPSIDVEEAQGLAETKLARQQQTVVDDERRETQQKVNGQASSSFKGESKQSTHRNLYGAKLIKQYNKTLGGKEMVCAVVGITASTMASQHKRNTEMLVELNRNIGQICQKPSTQGKYWQVHAGAAGGASLSWLRLPNAKLSGEAEFNREEWDGAQRVLREHQKDDNQGYRDCVKYLVPLFMDKFGG